MRLIWAYDPVLGSICPTQQRPNFAVATRSAATGEFGEFGDWATRSAAIRVRGDWATRSAATGEFGDWATRSAATVKVATQTPAED